MSAKFENALDDYISDVLRRNPEFPAKILRLTNPKIHQEMVDWWGEPCPDFDDECPVCAAWDAVLKTEDLTGLDVKTLGQINN